MTSDWAHDPGVPAISNRYGARSSTRYMVLGGDGLGLLEEVVIACRFIVLTSASTRN
jgi:hypothetical protein